MLPKNEKHKMPPNIRAKTTIRNAVIVRGRQKLAITHAKLVAYRLPTSIIINMGNGLVNAKISFPPGRQYIATNCKEKDKQ